MKRIKAASAIMLILSCGLHANASAAPSISPRPPVISSAMRVLSPYGVVTSTFRTPAHNKAVGGMPNSYHLVDQAIDVARRPGVSHLQIEAALKRAGYRLIESLDERDHSHFAFGPAIAAKAGSRDRVVLPVPAVPAPPPEPRVAADVHGTLHLDLTRAEPPTPRRD
jgi:hypothetical protein